jgi:hypothetical protein
VVGTMPSHPRHEEGQTLDLVHLLFSRDSAVE